ncbi:hypothetical protein [Spongiactinospora sp. TRM90649]|uniref:hypothetical protein n=1 Tax=Spongiactinospora sp. TRM90649 TaxID=3031114 RepID=UPI0023F71D03|nr:hypothetical protein [Spongiactinospora sp. TRM90649]MDF5758575.1 hypothetical protein [Spongiactinospora sp. TRM90649]
MTEYSTTQLLAAVLGDFRPDPADITPTVAAHVLWCYGEHGGREPGSFTKALIALIAEADQDNRRMLAAPYPAYAAAVHVIEAHHDGADRLRIMVGTSSCACSEHGPCPAHGGPLGGERHG